MTQNPYGQNPQQDQFIQSEGSSPDSVSAEAKSMAVFAHLSSVLAVIVTATTLSFLAPLIFWLIYKDKPGYEFTRESSRRAFNFNFSLWVIIAASWVIALITLGLLFFIPIIVAFLVSLVMIIFHILGALAANRGEQYEYPMTFIKILN